MAFAVDNDRTVCCRCGTAYGRKKGYFPVSYAGLYRGTGYLPFCRNCVDAMYNDYVTQCGDPKQAVRQLCRKLDIYWNETLYNRVSKKATTRTMMTNYLQSSNNIAYAGKSYDDTLIAENRLWEKQTEQPEQPEEVPVPEVNDTRDVSMNDIPDEAVEFWGAGYTPEMYQNLEQRRTYWINNLPESAMNDAGTEARIRQICTLEIDIGRLSAAGKSADKQIGMLNKLLDSIGLNAAQRESDAALEKTPFGVWIDRLEHERPVAEPDPELQDADGIIQKISIWFLGHAAKMLGIKNMYSQMYEDKMKEFAIESADQDEEDDDGYESLFNRIFGGGGDG